MTFHKVHLTLTSVISLITGMILTLTIIALGQVSSKVDKVNAEVKGVETGLAERFLEQKRDLLRLRDQTEQLFDTQYLFLSGLQNMKTLIPYRYRRDVLTACDRWQVPVAVLYLVTEVETGFVQAPPSRNPNGSYDRYITRINSYYERDFVGMYWDLHHRFNGNNPADAFYLTAAILSDLHKILKSWSRAIMAYNQGPDPAILSGQQVTSAYLKEGEKKLSRAANVLLAELD